MLLAAPPTANKAPHDLMSRSATAPDIRRRAVRVWLLAVAAMIFALVLVGGATRLTESGLSIVEWKPVTGTLPPLSAGDWEAEFEKYKSIPQYQQLNRGMSLDEFKTIYWWEWTHRLLGRLVGVVFLLPFLCFLWMGWVEPGWRLRLWTIFGLGAAQGAVGWWMVASGLAERVSVSQYRLAFHLTLACLILAATLWTAQRLLPQPALFPDGTKRLRASAIGLVVLVLCQIYLGALVAGLRAGLIYNTWPLIDGSFVPDAARLFVQDPWWRNLFENTLTVQFLHRTVAYLLWLAAIIHAVNVARSLKSRPAVTLAAAFALAVTIQAVLGILTLLNAVPIGLALAHQAMAILVLALAVVHAERLSPRSSLVPLGQTLAGAT
jgi:cytochrome c oxidase assembly protein subunit 15